MDDPEPHDIAMHRHSGTSQTDTKGKETVNEIDTKRSHGPGQTLAMDRENTVDGQITMCYLRRGWFQEGEKG